VIAIGEFNWEEDSEEIGYTDTETIVAIMINSRNTDDLLLLRTEKQNQDRTMNRDETGDQNSTNAPITKKHLNLKIKSLLSSDLHKFP
jgi:hypothetical protein